MRPFDAPKSSLGDLDATTVARVAAAASDLTLVLDVEGRVLDLSTNLDDLPQDDLGQWIGRAWIDTATVESRPKVQSLLESPAGATWASRPRHVNQMLPGGGELPVMCTAVRLGSVGGAERPDRWLVFCRDLRPEAALQQRLLDAQQSIEADYGRLREAQARYRQLMQAAREPVLVVEGGSMRVVEANAAAEQWFGGAPQRLVGEAFPVGFDPAATTRLREVLALVRSSGRAEDVRVRSLDV